MSSLESQTTTADDLQRQEAVERLKKRADFKTHLAAYLLVNALLVAVWYLTDRSFFWPIFPLGGWGIGLLFHAMDAYRRPFSDAQIRREIERARQG